MGFNAARLEWNAAGLAASPKTVSTSNCGTASTADIESSLLPPTSTDTPQPTGNPTLPQAPPTVTGETCSSDLPTSSTTDRYVYMVNYLCSQVCMDAFLCLQETVSRQPRTDKVCVLLLFCSCFALLDGLAEYQCTAYSCRRCTCCSCACSAAHLKLDRCKARK